MIVPLLNTGRVYKPLIIISALLFLMMKFLSSDKNSLRSYTNRTTRNLTKKIFDEKFTNRIEPIGPDCNRESILGPSRPTDRRPSLGGEQSNPCLIEIVRKRFLIPPSKIPENLDMIESPHGSTKFELVEKFVIEKDKPGFFIECGAADGIFLTSTLRLERTLKWKGLLIEPNPKPFAALKNNRKGSWLVNAALCIQPYAAKVAFFSTRDTQPNIGFAGMTERKREGADVRHTVQCLPLFTILSALNITQVDYFSLDVEGMELAILRTIPFDKIIFKLIIIEYTTIPEGKKGLTDFMKSEGFIKVGEDSAGEAGDLAFVHSSLRSKVSALNPKF